MRVAQHGLRFFVGVFAFVLIFCCVWTVQARAASPDTPDEVTQTVLFDSRSFMDGCEDADWVDIPEVEGGVFYYKGQPAPKRVTLRDGQTLQLVVGSRIGTITRKMLGFTNEPCDDDGVGARLGYRTEVYVPMYPIHRSPSPGQYAPQAALNTPEASASDGDPGPSAPTHPVNAHNLAYEAVALVVVVALFAAGTVITVKRRRK